MKFSALVFTLLTVMLWAGKVDAVTLPNELSYPDSPRQDVLDSQRGIQYAHKFSGGTVKVEFARQRNRLEATEVRLSLPGVTRFYSAGNVQKQETLGIFIRVALKRYPLIGTRFAEWTGTYENPGDLGNPYLPQWAILQYSADGYPINGRLYNYKLLIGAGRDKFGNRVTFGSANFNFDPATLGCERLLDAVDRLYGEDGAIYSQVSGAGERVAEYKAAVAKAKDRIAYLRENFPPPFNEAYGLEKSPFNEGLVVIKPIGVIRFDQFMTGAAELGGYVNNVREIRESLSIGKWRPREDAVPLTEETLRFVELSESIGQNLYDEEIPGEIEVVEGISPSALDFATLAISRRFKLLDWVGVGAKLAIAIDAAQNGVTMKEAAKFMSEHERFRRGVQATLDHDEQLLRNHERRRDKLIDRMHTWINAWESKLLSDEKIVRCWRDTGRADTESFGSYLQRQSTRMRLELLFQ